MLHSKVTVNATRGCRRQRPIGVPWPLHTPSIKCQREDLDCRRRRRVRKSLRTALPVTPRASSLASLARQSQTGIGSPDSVSSLGFLSRRLKTSTRNGGKSGQGDLVIKRANIEGEVHLIIDLRASRHDMGCLKVSGGPARLLRASRHDMGCLKVSGGPVRLPRASRQGHGLHEKILSSPRSAHPRVRRQPHGRCQPHRDYGGTTEGQLRAYRRSLQRAYSALALWKFSPVLAIASRRLAPP